MEKQIFADKLRSLRREYNLTQRELAKEIGVGAGVISDIERGTRPPSERVAIKLANKYNTDVDYWLDIESGIEQIIKESPYKQLCEGLDQLVEEGIIKTPNDFDDPEIMEIIKDLMKFDFRKRKVLESIEKNNEHQK